MAHFAKVNEDNIVETVLVTDNNLPDEGLGWLEDNFGGRWIKTSYNTYRNQHKLGGIPLRGNYAGIGFSYLPDVDLFMPPKPYNSWVLNQETCEWDAPIAYPSDGKLYAWNESVVNWVEVQGE